MDTISWKRSRNTTMGKDMAIGMLLLKENR